MDPLEAKLPKAGKVVMIDPETGFETLVNTDNPNLRMGYEKLMRRQHEGVGLGLQETRHRLRRPHHPRRHARGASQAPQTPQPQTRPARSRWNDETQRLRTHGTRLARGARSRSRAVAVVRWRAASLCWPSSRSSCCLQETQARRPGSRRPSARPPTPRPPPRSPTLPPGPRRETPPCSPRSSCASIYPPPPAIPRFSKPTRNSSPAGIPCKRSLPRPRGRRGRRLLPPRRAEIRRRKPRKPTPPQVIAESRALAGNPAPRIRRMNALLEHFRLAQPGWLLLLLPALLLLALRRGRGAGGRRHVSRTCRSSSASENASATPPAASACRSPSSPSSPPSSPWPARSGATNTKAAPPAASTS